jgi:hypothetical protein
VRGALGSSPTIAIVFAPITLAHVLAAIYVCHFTLAHLLPHDLTQSILSQLEYFGRPLGLWRTSAKLAHTLFEVLFICAWAASLSLSFDNYFTSPLECTPRSVVNWWNELPEMPNPLDSRPDGDALGNSLCHQQVALICLVFLGLTFYCSNLVISLYRIIEKVKWHSTTTARPVRH